MRSKGRQLRRIAAIATAGAALLAAGCGEDESYTNAPRSPATIVLATAINEDEVSVSPEELGAGPVSVVITNQTSAAQAITFESVGGADGFRQETGPINPGDTATRKADVPAGEMTVRVQGSSIAPARLTADSPRASAQDELLQP